MPVLGQALAVKGRSRPIRLVLAAVAAGAAALAGCSCAGDESAAPATTDDPGVSHVHGLGVRPGDDAIYAATHYGLFEIAADGKATRVADRYQDTMAFTVDGADRFLASGHPDFQDDELQMKGKPPHLGLIESRDKAKTWKAISLLGEADFHALSVVGETIYGYDATGDRLMVSGDGGATWDTRASGIGMRGVAASPEGDELVLGVTPAGLEVSDDGGLTFEPLPESPPAVLVSWPTPDRLWSIDASGGVYRADSPTGPWTAAGQAPGEPQAFTATGDTLAIAVSGLDGRTAIFVSRDGASTWSLRYRDTQGT